jgi:hypothetical protein
MFFELGVNRLRESPLLEAHNAGAFHSEKFLQIFARVMLHDGVMRELLQNFRAAVFRQVVRDEDEVKFALAASQRVAADHENARAQHKRKHAFDTSGGFVHGAT